MRLQPIFKQLFGSYAATIICLLLALVNKTSIAWLYSDLVGDKSSYLILTQSFLETGLFTEPVKIFETGATVYLYNPAANSPLYSLLAAPFFWITKSYFITQLTVSVVGWLLFFTAVYKTAALFFKERWMKNLFILCTGFFLYPHELASTPKDTLAVAFVLWTVFFICRFLQTPNWKNILLLACSIAGFCLTKLLYVPIAGCLLAILFAVVIRTKSKQHLIYCGTLIGCLVVVALTVYFLVLTPAYNLAKQQAISLPNDGTIFLKGFYPQNLLHTYPFMSSSIFNTNFWAVQIEQVMHISYSKVTKMFRVADVVILLLLAALFAIRFKKTQLKLPAVFLFAASLTIIAAVVYLSLTHSPFSYKSASAQYTYVSEARTFLLPIITIQLGLFYFIFYYTGLSSLRKFVLVLFVFECLHGAYFTAKQILKSKEVMQARNNNDAIKKFTSYFIEENKKHPGTSLVTSDNALRRYAELKGISTHSFSNQALNLSWMERGSRFIVATHLQDSACLKNFPSQGLVPLDTMHPFITHRYVAK